MAEIGLAAINNRATPIPNIFIERHMAKANPGFVTVYIYAYKSWYWGEGGSFHSEKIARELDLMESDVIRAFKYWDKEGVIKFNESDGKMNVTFLELSSEKEDPLMEIKEEIVKEETKEEEAKTPPDKKAAKKTILMNKPPHYEVREINLYKENNESVRKLFESAAGHLGKILNHNDMSLIFSLHDWLRLPVDVIEELLSFCTSNSKWSMRYIETVAIDWSERGISTAEEAKEHVRLYNTDFREILKSMGIKNREPHKEEEQYMFTWLKEYKMPLELIKLAGGKTIMQLGQVKFSYTHKILKEWNENNIKTLEEVRKSEEEYIKNKIATGKDKPAYSGGKKSQNRFVNYEQRSDWDFEALEKMDREFLDNELKGNEDE